MVERAVQAWGRAAQALDALLERRAAVAVLLLALAVLVKLASLPVGITRFSPDSWSYFELARTVFGLDFYRFNTFRSYFSHEYSASFPLGYPVLLALASAVFGARPLLAVDVNIAAAVATVWVLLRICRHLRLPAITGLALGLSALLYPPYLDELVAGRAMPVALLLFLCAGLLQMRGRHLAAGWVLGLSVLCRFDFLVYALLYQAAFLALHLREVPTVARLALGFAAGIAPWVAYSLVHFGKPWVSDNSWVALSALPAFVVDYPAVPVVSAIQDPAAWLRRVLGNVPRLLEALGQAALMAPVLWVFAMASLGNWRQGPTKAQGAGLLALACASMGPYLLTGYFDARYFSLVFLCLALLMALGLGRSARWAAASRGLALLAIALTVPMGLAAAAKGISDAPAIARQLDEQARRIAHLQACQQKTPRTIYIFIDEVLGFAPMYGAVSGMRTAFIASNYPRMTEAQRQAFFDHLQPHRIIRTMRDIEQCHRQ